MRVIDLALKDLRQLVRDRSTAFFMIAMPIVFTLFFGLIFGGQGDETDPRLPVAFLNHDSAHPLSANLSSLLESSDAVRPVLLKQDSAETAGELVSDGERAAVIVVPAGFGQGILDGDLVKAVVIVDQSQPSGQTALHAIETAVTRLLGVAQISRISTQASEALKPFEDHAARQTYHDEALSLASEAWRDPPLSVTVEKAAGSSEEDERLDNYYAQSSPGMIIQFTIHGLLMSGMVMVLERKTGTLQRLLSTPMTRAQIIAGKTLSTLVPVLVQETLLIAVGQFAFGVDYLREPLATLFMMVALALWASSLGLLIGALAKAEEQVHTWSLIAMFVFSALGGAWFPLEIAGKTFAAIGHLTPTAWAMDGFQNIIVRGQGLSSVLLPVGILLAYAAVFFAVAIWRFKFE